ncbi:MAG: GmrSD restriction endonuclease domain-containing protein [bacterium]
MKIATILDLIDLGSMALPEFQRGYVWSRDQVRSLMQSLYRRYPHRQPLGVGNQVGKRRSQGC